MILEFIFISSIFLVLYTYLLYPVILLVLSLWKRSTVSRHFDFMPSVSMIIPVYNEEKVIADKLENCRKLNYPPDKLEILIGSDSTDGTDAAIANNMLPNVRHHVFA